MTGDLVYAFAAEGEEHELLYHLLRDYILKGVILLVALMVLATGMVIVWKKVGRRP